MHFLFQTWHMAHNVIYLMGKEASNIVSHHLSLICQNYLPLPSLIFLPKSNLFIINFLNYFFLRYNLLKLLLQRQKEACLPNVICTFPYLHFLQFRCHFFVVKSTYLLYYENLYVVLIT